MSKVIELDFEKLHNHYFIDDMHEEFKGARAILGSEENESDNTLHEDDKKEFPYHLDLCKHNGEWIRYIDYELKEEFLKYIKKGEIK